MGLLGQTTLTRRRFAAGTYVDGRSVPGGPTDTSFVGSLQELTERDRRVLPEGVRSSDGRKVYLEIPGTLRVDDQHTGEPADQVVLTDGKVFTVVKVSSADNHPLITHQKATLLRIQERA